MINFNDPLTKMNTLKQLHISGLEQLRGQQQGVQSVLDMKEAMEEENVPEAIDKAYMMDMILNRFEELINCLRKL